MMTLEEAKARDAADPLRTFRSRFALPQGVIYLDGNSLGPLPRAAIPALGDCVERQWGERLIRSWNEGWIEAPRRVGGKIAQLIGAQAHEVIVADSTSANLFKALVAALRRDPARTTIVSEQGNFHTDLHIAKGAAGCVPGATLKAVARDAVLDTLGPDTAILLLTHVHYKTAERFDLASVTRAAHDAGALVLWDLSHSCGALPIDLNSAAADLAVGCGYKYLNGGPGAPAWLFVAERWQAALSNPLSGWMGHVAPFAFEDRYRPAEGIDRWLTGTPPILGLATLEAGVDLWLETSLDAAWAKSVALFDVMAATGDSLGLACVSPRDPARRGSHISFRHSHAYELCQALIARGVIGDFRAPDILRFGLTPLYIGFEDMVRAGDILADVLRSEAYRDPAFSERNAVT